MERDRSRGRALCALLALAAATACGPGADPEVILARWFDAVHEGDHGALAAVDLSAPPERPEGEGPPPASWSDWVAGVVEASRGYLAQRDTGRFEPDPRGYGLVLATRVGRGTFWQVERVEDGRGAPSLVLALNFGYGEIPFGSLPPGTTVYLLGHPLGTVHPVVLGKGERHRLTLLEHAYLRARLAPAPPGAPPTDAPLKVEGIGWAEDPPVTARVDWVF